MAIVLGANQYGKAEIRLVRVDRDTPRHEMHDLSVTTTLRGDFAAAHTAGDQAKVLPTDSQKNTVYAFAKEYGVGEIEDFADRLARHFTETIPSVTGARVEVESYAWDRIRSAGPGHDHSFVRRGQDVRTTAVTVDGKGPNSRTWIVSGVKDLVVLKSTGSEFRGFLKDRYTTLEETDDRILATSLVARWRYAAPAGDGEKAGDPYAQVAVDWGKSFAAIRATILATFGSTHSLALQQTLHAMGTAVLEVYPEVAEVRFSAPNKHHFAVDLTPFGLDNPGEVFLVADRPYGLIEASVTRDDAPDPGLAWSDPPGAG
ncbi:MAG TPA: urate oxidase [Streptosporangiaceae bacterium]|jgi:urate oxidase